ncbi:pentapeptide repeat-containing protein [Streptomyces tubbatahanensis]|uniref:Pentapeptide repeat-containing protein n=1 Tax=Streptomyces tubbatahanensis TaxID=2923272 RepID=A0ABY3XRL8_9ACTN|nr:pentapeptide repeat-containing protein [Streptomyces tubbatahanensis]UNS97121.1 pentapeptide repeat-containing protein [Streptomyces tubbatahanensis]
MPMEPPHWPHCGWGADEENRTGCRGRRVSPYTRCLAHLREEERAEHLGALRPGAGVDYSGTRFAPALLQELLSALRGPDDIARFGWAAFEQAVFASHASFFGAHFGAGTRFDGAEFGNDVSFKKALFEGAVWFSGASFGENTSFTLAQFGDGTLFPATRFGDRARFRGAVFGAGADFHSAVFGERAHFEEARFGEGVSFGAARFGARLSFNKTTFTGRATFADTQFGDRATVERAAFAGLASFDRARFGDRASFAETVFHRAVNFHEAGFDARPSFRAARFHGVSQFGSSAFGERASFRQAAFRREAHFGGARFSSHVSTRGAVFEGQCFFSRATFSDSPELTDVRFLAGVDFTGVTFDRTARFGPLVCRGTLDLSEVTFSDPVTLEVDADRVTCWRTRWAATAMLRVRRADVDLSDAVFEQPMSLVAHAEPFPMRSADGTTHDARAGDAEAASPVRVLSLRGVDAAQLMLDSVDLSACRMAGAVHLDQIRLEGEYRFGRVPPGWHRRGRFPTRWTSRITLAEEQHWRAARNLPGWDAGPDGARVLSPAALASLYRQLRKSFEDAKDEPGGADFYYGEMEMRRADRTRPRGERALLHAYWVLSGYGLRATRALAWLGLAMGATVLVMMAWGIPQHAPAQEATGRLKGDEARLVIDTPDPGRPPSPLHARFTADRFDQSLRVVLNSVVFRSSGQDLTTAGTYVEMGSRVSEPILLGLAVLAVRGRVKR